ncbi:MAG: hypothetical protein ACRDMV_17565 [Streptosporangiales bacterium]
MQDAIERKWLVWNPAWPASDDRRAMAGQPEDSAPAPPAGARPATRRQARLYREARSEDFEPPTF